MVISRLECPDTSIHPMHVYEINQGERWACIGRGTEYYSLSPQELAEFQELDLDTLKRDAKDIYLVSGHRTEQGFRDLWNRWARGKSNMPLCVESAAEDPREGDSARTVLEYMKAIRERDDDE